jgi:hypothetical protein
MEYVDNFSRPLLRRKNVEIYNIQWMFHQELQFLNICWMNLKMAEL